MAKRPSDSSERSVVGWREWVALPDFDTAWIKAKMDTGARSSALHAFDVSSFERDGEPWVRFEVHPWQRSNADAVEVEAPVADWRTVRSSNGSLERRPVVTTNLRLGERQFPMELTLTRRDEMGFRLLIGRQAIRGHFLVDPDRSYIAGKPPREIRDQNRRRSR